jgi:beta-glucanase (GH16 family)
LECRRLLSGTGLTGAYFSNQTVSGSPTLTHVDSTVNFNWGTSAPAPSIPQTHFSVQWSGQVQAMGSGTYYFDTYTDDGVQLWVNGQKIINDWTDHSATGDQGSITLSAGQKYNIVLQYYQDTGTAICELAWSSPTFSEEIIPQASLFPTAGGDTTPPTTPTNLRVASTTSSSVTLSWTASTDNAGVAGYAVYRNSTFVGNAAANATTFTDSGLTANNTYSYWIDAFDAAGNVSNFTSTVSASTAASSTPQPPIPGTWNMIFDDEFNTLNNNTWSNEYWWGGNAGTQATFDPKQLSVSNGILTQTAVEKSETASNGVTNPYTSGLMTTGGLQGVRPASFTFTYGYVETRAQIAPGQGMWSAFWMLPADYSDTNEIDIYENLGRLPNNDQGFYHYNGNYTGFSTATASNLTTGFHTYGVDWEPNSITWYMDGKEMFSTTTDVVNKPMYLLMNLDVGGSWAGPLNSSSPASSSWLTDYVRVWQHPT